ncbi:MAG: FAD-binding oxidoreductase [Gammaproteobacteria bacterium]|nr:FAD-binding oxidoreductase [Gammaproteobacteria bacterium]
MQPANAQQVSEIVSICRENGLYIVARGGGMSYTDSYLHATRRGISIDMRRINRIIDINTRDMIVTVECGCTWQKLNEALAVHGLRSPYWGPLSGMRATIGGALSQNSVFWGGTSYGTAAESVIGLDVLLGNGEILPTGAHGKKEGVPFMRYDGPDLTGLFIGDSGALGIKTVATLRLVTIPAVVKYASFSFDTHQQICTAMSEIGRRGLAAECYGFDPFLQNSRVLGGDTDVVEDVKTLARVAGKSGLKESLKIAASGRRFVNKVQWGLHVNVEDRCEAGADYALAEIRGIVGENGGAEIPNSLPTIVGAYPFPPTNSMVGPDGERWVPIHGKVGHSQAVETIDEIQVLYRQNEKILKRYRIDTGYLICTVGNTTFLVEPVFYWPDELNEVHRRNVEPDVFEGFTQVPANPEARNEVERLRNEVRNIFLRQGAVHFQIGKYYPYRDSRRAAAWEMLGCIKELLDEHGIINPGQLGLNEVG